jgi:hypothetical protein
LEHPSATHLIAVVQVHSDAEHLSQDELAVHASFLPNRKLFFVYLIIPSLMFLFDALTKIIVIVLYAERERRDDWNLSLEPIFLILSDAVFSENTDQERLFRRHFRAPEVVYEVGMSASVM